jgi:hypothetical protein
MKVRVLEESRWRFVVWHRSCSLSFIPIYLFWTILLLLESMLNPLAMAPKRFLIRVSCLVATRLPSKAEPEPWPGPGKIRVRLNRKQPFWSRAAVLRPPPSRRLIIVALPIQTSHCPLEAARSDSCPANNFNNTNEQLRQVNRSCCKLYNVLTISLASTLKSWRALHCLLGELLLRACRQQGHRASHQARLFLHAHKKPPPFCDFLPTCLPWMMPTKELLLAAL